MGRLRWGRYEVGMAWFDSMVGVWERKFGQRRMLDVSVHHYSAFSIVRLSGIDIGITERRKHNYSTKRYKRRIEV